MKCLIIADAVSEIFPASDTSLAIARAAMQRGHELWWADSAHVVLCNQRTVARAQRIVASSPGEMPELGAAQTEDVGAFDAIIIRKNPPFDDTYTRLCWLLLPYEHRVVISNAASLLLQHHEKMVPYQAVAAGCLHPNDLVPTCVTDNAELAVAFTEEIDNAADYWIAKPWLGFAGHSVRKLHGVDAVSAYVASSTQPLMIQPFLPEVAQGDRRVIFVGGEVVADVMRVPKAGDYISNLAHGGVGELHPMDEATTALCTRLGRYLRAQGFDFAGADVIGSYVTEVNVTSPTALVAITDLGGPDVAPLLIERLEKRVACLAETKS